MNDKTRILLALKLIEQYWDMVVEPDDASMQLIGDIETVLRFECDEPCGCGGCCGE